MNWEKWAWALIWTAGFVAASFAPTFVDLLGEARAAGVLGLIGVGLGWTWYRLYPRSLVERIHLVGVAIVAASLLALTFGGELSRPTVRSMVGVGVLGGLILAETRREGGEWQHQSRTRLSSPGTMRELR